MKLEKVFAERMREAREAEGLSQEALGILAGIDEATAKVRINQYENAKHTPPLSMINTIASVLKRPVTWFLCEDDVKALNLAINQLSKSKRPEALIRAISVIELDSKTQPEN